MVPLLLESSVQIYKESKQAVLQSEFTAPVHLMHVQRTVYMHYENTFIVSEQCLLLHDQALTLLPKHPFDGKAYTYIPAEAVICYTN